MPGGVNRVPVAIAVALVSLLTIAELVRLRPYSIEDMRPINELRMAPRWKLGRALAKVDKAQGERTDRSTSSGRQKKLLLQQMCLDKSAAMQAPAHRHHAGR
jgi:hypothetical protein